MVIHWMPPDIPVRQDQPAVMREAPVNRDAVDLNAMPPIFRLKQVACTKVEGILKDNEKTQACAETASGAKELAREMELIAKIKAKTPDYAGSHLEAVEKAGKLKIQEIPWRDLVALYEKGGNLLSFFHTDGEGYASVAFIRAWVLSGWFEVFLKAKAWADERKENGIYNLYIGWKCVGGKEDELWICVGWKYEWWEKITPFTENGQPSERYTEMVLKAVDMMQLLEDNFH